MRYRANARVVSPGGKEIGRVSYIVKARNKSQALAKLRQMLKAKNRKRKKNVEMGFFDSKGFHPIRASADYMPYKSGEFPRRGASSAERKAASRMARHRMRK